MTRISRSILAAIVGAAFAANWLMASAADTANGAMYVCRAVGGSETGNAQMMGTTQTSLVCRQVNIALKMSNGTLRTIGSAGSHAPTGPDLAGALTSGQVNDAWARFVMSTFHVEHSP